MFCTKCHTELDVDAKYCWRCGKKIKENKKNKVGQFSNSRTFERMNVKKLLKEEEEKVNKKEELEEHVVDQTDHNDTHNTQYEYSKKYSDVKKIDNKEHVEQYEYSKKYSNTEEKPVLQESDYKNAYIGTNADFISKVKTSIPALIFGPFYYLYRKLYLQGFLLLVIYSLTYHYLNDDLALCIRLLIQIYAAKKFTEVYLKEVSNKVDQIKKENPDKTSLELIELCREKGGTLKIKYIVLIFILYIFLNANVESDETYYSEIDQNRSIGTISYQIPKSSIVKTNYTNYQYYLIEDGNNSCNLKVVENHELIEDYDLEKKDYSKTEETMNNILLNHYTSPSTYKPTNIYVISKDNNLYEFTFTSDSYEKDTCTNTINYVLNTIK